MKIIYEKHVGPVKLIMFDISKIKPKFILTLITVPQFSQCLLWQSLPLLMSATMLFTMLMDDRACKYVFYVSSKQLSQHRVKTLISWHFSSFLLLSNDSCLRRLFHETKYLFITLGRSVLYVVETSSCRAASQCRTSVFCMDFTCKIREYEFGLQNTEIELCQFCHIKYCCQNKAYLFWVTNQ